MAYNMADVNFELERLALRDEPQMSASKDAESLATTEQDEITNRVNTTVHVSKDISESELKDRMATLLSSDVQMFMVKKKKSSFQRTGVSFDVEFLNLSSSKRMDASNFLGSEWCRGIKRNTISSDMWLEIRPSKRPILDAKYLQCPKHRFDLIALSFGAFKDSGTYVSHFRNRTDRLQKAKATFEHDIRSITVKLCHQNNIVQLLETSFDNLDKFVLVSVDAASNTVNLYLFLHRPVKLSEGKLVRQGKNFDILQLIKQEHNVQRYNNLKRTATFGDCPEGVIGSSNVMNIEIRLKEADYSVFEGLLFKLLKQKFTPLFASPKVVQFKSDFMPSRSCSFSSFEATFAWYCLESRGFKLSDQFCPEFLNLVASENDPNLVAEILYSLIRITEKQSICSLKETYENELKKIKLQLAINESSCTSTSNARFSRIRKLVLTPSTQRGLQGEQVQHNRVIREFGSDHFLSVSVRDENGELLTSSSCSHELTAQKFEKFLSSGLHIGDRHYRYLGSSNSQLREHSVWMYASDGVHTIESIRIWMGDFSNERCVATYVSRIGQCFSDSQETIEVTNAEFIPDIEHNGFIFTDGIGKISISLANEISKRIHKSPTPSAFQIRFGGCKGVVAVDPSLGSDCRLQIRKSMEKFSSSHQKLEILEYSKPVQLYLNRQVIVLLSGLGVPDSAFCALQDNMLHNMVDMLLKEDVAECEIAAIKLDMNKKRLKECGIMLTLEPFFRSMLKLLYQQRFRNLLDRTRIKIPADKGRLMMGTVDETDSLKYGEVFVQYSKNIENPQKEKIVKEGLVVVTKNPCLHPGDVRKFVAVSQPKLSHMVDCIVFPAKGVRPHPNEISGSDLDGDMYFVCWEETLFSPDDNKVPMDYRAGEKECMKNPITEKDVFKYITKYILSAQLGVIANAHLVHADAQKDGIFSKPCTELARIHSDAVDAPKSGRCPTIPFELRPQSYPHYMNKKDKTIYTSKNIVAKLYDQCRAIDQALFYHTTSKIDLDQDFEVSGFEKYLDRAQEILEEYRQQMHTLLDRFELESEIEAWTGQIVTTKKRGDTFEISAKINGPMMELKRKIKEMFNNEFKIMTAPRESHYLSKKQKVSAIYRVTYDYASNNQDKSIMLGLPWLFYDILADIKSENMKKRASKYQNFQEKASILRKLSIEMRSFYSQTRVLEHHLEVYKKLCRLVINNHIAAKLVLFGSAVTLISNISSSVDILIESEDSSQCSNSDTFHSVITAVLNLPSNKQNEVQYVTRGQQKFVLNMNDVKVCLFSDRKYLQRTAFICAAICKNKWMIPCMKVLAEWANLDKNKKMFGSGSSCLLSIEDLLLLLISLSLKSSATRNVLNEIDQHDCSTVTDLLILNHFQWCPIDICSHLDKNSTNCKDKIISTCRETSFEIEAEMISLYFKHYSSAREKKGVQILDIIDPSLPEKPFVMLHIKDEQYLQLSDRMTQAYHEFAHATSIADFLQIKQIADDHMYVNLPSQVSAYIAFSSVYQEQKLKEASRADSLSIRLKKFRNGTSTLVLDAFGNSNALLIINQSIQDLNKAAVMMTKGGDIKPRIMGEESYHLAFEGCCNEEHIIKIEKYTGPRQQNHDTFMTHIPKLLPSSGSTTNNYDFEKLFEAFRNQIHLVRQTYDEHCFGDLQIVISYGTYYLTNSRDQQLTEREFINLINHQRESNNERLVSSQNGRTSKRKSSNSRGNRSHSRQPFYVSHEDQQRQFKQNSNVMNISQGNLRKSFNYPPGYRQGSGRQFYMRTENSRFHGYDRHTRLSYQNQGGHGLASHSIADVSYNQDYDPSRGFNIDCFWKPEDIDFTDQFQPCSNAGMSLLSRPSSSSNSTETQSHPELLGYKSIVRTAFIPGRTANVGKLIAFLESRNFSCTKRLEEYRVSIKLNILGESNESRQSSIKGVLILNENFNFQTLQLPYTKWLAFDTIRGTNFISKEKEYDVRFKISSRMHTANEEVLREYDCEDLLINANRILQRKGANVIGVCKDYQKRTDFLRHKHLEVYECQDKSRDLAPEDVFLRSVKIKINRGHEFSRLRNGRFNSEDRDRVEVTCTLPLPDLHELAVSDTECRNFVKWIWLFGLELGAVLI